MMSIQDPNSLFRIVEARVDIARVKVSRAREGRQRERERTGGRGREAREINMYWRRDCAAPNENRGKAQSNPMENDVKT
jgi:hypothetical protein